MKVFVEDLLAAPSLSSDVNSSVSIHDSISFSRRASYFRWITRLTLLFSDVVALCTVINILLITGMVTDLSLPEIKPLILSFLLFPLAYMSFGLYKTVILQPELEISSYTKANLAVLAGLSVPVLVIPQFQLGMVLWLCFTAPLVILILPFFRVLTRIMFASAPWWGGAALVISDKEKVDDVMEQLNRYPEQGIKPTLLLEYTHNKQAPAGEESSQNTIYTALAQQYGISNVVLAIKPEMEYEFLARHKGHPVFQNIFLARQEETGHLFVKQLNARQPLYMGVGNDYMMDQCRLGVKYVIDILGASLAFVISAPLFVAIAALVKMTSKGPIFFKQKRMGKEGKIIDVLKFRTMHVNAEKKLQELLEQDPILRQEYEIFHKLRDDPRITSIGKVLRRYSLDELPQLWSVIRGDMSLVGPRAYIPRECPQMRGYETDVLECPPGVTGLWQVSGRNKLSFDERVDIDVHYKKRWSLALDLYILLKTIPVVLTGHGAS